MTPEEIESFTRKEMYSAFPHADCDFLRRKHFVRDGFIPDLSSYSANVVGFASSACQIPNRDPELIRQYIRKVRASFFELHPQYAEMQQFINTTDTPELHREFKNLETIRKEILPLLERRLDEDQQGRQ